ncbi:uncharacterized protein LOC105690289 [Athalia rosae]|uniref:uncharacterized protein LOC105690289 n=1 Tax=Athalia rosae TaxID=37344 RepID=UPI0020347F05|nr:uncharacterized protein LOC105690289 [Athalia rosae]
MDWFLDIADAELLCTCEETSSKTSNDTCSVEKSCTDHRENSSTDIDSENNQCVDVKSSYSSDAYCQCGSGIEDEEMRTYDAQYSGSSGSSILSSCTICSNATLCSNCKLSSYKENSDHRLDNQPDLTICKKCAADRRPKTEVHEDVAYHKDSQMLDLDKYCHYKDWDTIYRIRTQIPDDEQMIQVDKDQLMMRGEDVPLKLERQDHQITEADRNIFTDAYKPLETRKISLNSEYRCEYGLNIKIHQPQHYSC